MTGTRLRAHSPTGTLTGAPTGTLAGVRVGDRVEAHPHRPKVKAGRDRAISVRALPGGKVTYVHLLVIEDARFVVQSRGHARATREQVRNVHAWVRGTVTSIAFDSDTATSQMMVGCEAPDSGWVRVVYNPFAGSAFRVSLIDPDTGAKTLGAAVTGAETVIMQGAQCWALNPTYA